MAGIEWRTEGPSKFIKENWELLVRRLGAVDLTPQLFFKSSASMDELESGCMDLVVTSPPYPYIDIWDSMFETALGLPEGSLQSDISYLEACHGLLDAVWRECHRVLRPSGMLCVNIGDATRKVGRNFRCVMNHVRVVEACEELGFTSLIPVLWSKPTNKPNSFLGSGFYPSNAYVTLDCEYILIFRKGERRKFPPKDLLRQASQFSKAERDLWFSQIWAIKGARQEGHAIFPKEIPYRLIRMYSVLGDSVLDPFAGTGQTLMVARGLGRKPLGYEANPELKKTLAKVVPTAPLRAEQVFASLLDHYAKDPKVSETTNAHSNRRSKISPLDSYEAT